MKKIGLLFKEESENLLKKSLKSSKGVFIVKYSGISSPDLTSLRHALKNIDVSLFVVKNSVVRRTLKDSTLKPLINNIEGPCAMVFAKEEPVGASCLLANFTREHPNLKVEAGILDDVILEKKDIEVLARLPSKEVLRAKVVMALNSPISGLVITLNQILRKFVFCLDQIKNKRAS